MVVFKEELRMRISEEISLKPPELCVLFMFVWCGFYNIVNVLMKEVHR
jgi:hypothetical protein